METVAGSDEPNPDRKTRTTNGSAIAALPRYHVGRQRRQTPLRQCKPFEHASVHTPQCRSSVARFTHSPSHRVRSVVHMQTLSEHTLPVVHAVSHPPQWLRFEVVFTHESRHRVCDGAHMATHTPAPQSEADRGHTVPHVPQFCGSLVRSTHALPHAVTSTSHTGAAASSPASDAIAASEPTADPAPKSNDARPHANAPSAVHAMRAFTPSGYHATRSGQLQCGVPLRPLL